MKKWIFTILIYGLGFLYLRDAVNEMEWFSSIIRYIMDNNNSMNLYYYTYAIAVMIPLSLVLLNYFILRIRANNAAFTLINALMLPILFVLILMSRRIGYSGGFKELFEALAVMENWKTIWTAMNVVLIASGINLIAGIVISEAKSKGAYLTAEFIYLFTGVFIGIMMMRFM